MTLHLYAVTERGAALPSVSGIGGSPLQRVEVEALDAIVSEVAGMTDATEAAVLAHAAVVDAIAQSADAVLPARFTAGFTEDAAVVSAVAERAEDLRQALERVRGCVELGLRVLASEDGAPSPAPEGSGRAYMLARLDRVRAADGVTAELEATLGRAARASTTSVAGTDPLVVTAAYLVPRDAVEAFRARVAALEQTRPKLTLVCTGPWPPYSFATVDAAER